MRAAYRHMPNIRSLMIPVGILLGTFLSFVISRTNSNIDTTTVIQLGIPLVGFSLMCVGISLKRADQHKTSRILAIVLVVVGSMLLCFGIYDIAGDIYSSD
jgi:hypothetical protein